jgi:hypothetical protein
LQEYVCGPDITPKVLGVLRKIYDDYQSWTPEKRSEKCSAITEWNFPHYEGSWNILQLAPGDFETWLRLTAPDCCKPRPDCYPTAIFLGQCYHVQVINYVMWGAINTLCGNKRENIRHWLRSWYARVAYWAPQPYDEQRLMVNLGQSFVGNWRGDETEVRSRLQELMTALDRDIGSRRYRQCTLTCQQTPQQRELLEGHSWGYYWGKGR